MNPLRSALASLIGLLVLVPLSSATAAEGELIRLDASRSQVGFKVKVMWLLGVNGRFGKVEGVVRADPFRNRLSVDARIDVGSVSMGRRTYEEWVKSPEFFDAAAHPQIVFQSEPFPRARLKSGGELRGELTMRGIRQPVSFDLRPAECDRPAYDCPIRVDGAVKRSQFGMGSHRGSLADRVDLEFSVFASPPPEDAGATPG